MKRINKKKEFKDDSIILGMQHDRQTKSKMELEQLDIDLDKIDSNSKQVGDNLDELLNIATSIDTSKISYDNDIFDIYDEIDNILDNDDKITNEEDKFDLHVSSNSYSDLLDSAYTYNDEHGIDNKAAYKSMMSNYDRTQLSEELVQELNLSTLTKVDYAFATLSGIISGMIDVLFVGTIGTSGSSALQSTTDKAFKKMVRGYAKMFGWSGPKSGSDPTASAIGFLERKYKVGYDAPNSSYLSKQAGQKVIEGMTPMNHHAESVPHSLTPLGLIIGLWDLINGTSTVVSPSDGSWNCYKVDNGMNPQDAIVKAIPEWFGHCMSDISGASGSVGHGNRGQGLPSPLHDIFEQFSFGKIKYNDSKETLNIAQMSEKMFENGYDFRSFMAQSLPVILNEVLVRCYWVARQHFYYGKSWSDSLPSKDSRDFDNMIFTATATFSAIDITDAVIKGGAEAAAGNPLKLLLTINYPGLVDLGFRSIRKIRNDLNHVKELEENEDDVQAEWSRIFKNNANTDPILPSTY